MQSGRMKSYIFTDRLINTGLVYIEDKGISISGSKLPPPFEKDILLYKIPFKLFRSLLSILKGNLNF